MPTSITRGTKVFLAVVLLLIVGIVSKCVTSLRGIGKPQPTEPALVASSPTPTPTPNLKEKLRAVFAYQFRQNLHENGCGDCEVAAAGTMLIVANPNVAPRAAASAILSNKKTVKSLKTIGFETLRVKQGTSILFGEHFDYAIK